MIEIDVTCLGLLVAKAGLVARIWAVTFCPQSDEFLGRKAMYHHC